MVGKGVVLITILMYMLTTKPVYAGGPFSFITSLLQSNVAGRPVVHERTFYDFNPEDGIKGRQEYFERCGYRGEICIERFGLGTDGREEERRAQQKIRDQGRLNGEQVINFP